MTTRPYLLDETLVDEVLRELAALGDAAHPSLRSLGTTLARQRRDSETRLPRTTLSDWLIETLRDHPGSKRSTLLEMADAADGLDLRLFDAVLAQMVSDKILTVEPTSGDVPTYSLSEGTKGQIASQQRPAVPQLLSDRVPGEGVNVEVRIGRVTFAPLRRPGDPSGGSPAASWGHNDRTIVAAILQASLDNIHEANAYDKGNV